MQKPKMISVSLTAAKEIARLLDRLEGTSCIGCEGTWHSSDCPAQKAFQMHNYLTRRINNRNRHFGV